MAHHDDDNRDDADSPDGDDASLSMPKIHRHVQPLGPRVLVRVLPSDDRSAGGLYLPVGAKQQAAQALLGEVVEVARTQPNTHALPLDDDDDDEPDLGTNVSGVPLGSQVLFGREKGIVVPWDDTLRIIDVRHVLAIVESIPEDVLQ